MQVSGRRSPIFFCPDDREIRAQLFRELLLVELEYRRLNGEQPKQKDYLLEFPEFASQIEAIDLQYRDVAFATSSARREGERCGKHCARRYVLRTSSW